MLPRPLLPLFLLAALAAAQTQPIDEGYTRQIREFTTAPHFLTELVDHLPASATVPTPEKALGYIAGAKDKLTYAAEIHKYMRDIDAASPRVRVLSMGQSEEGREMILVLISDEANLKRLDDLKRITHRLADPRGVPEAEADKLVATGVPFYWTTGAIHSTETGAPHMLMELVYRLAVAETPLIQNIRKNLVVMVTPVIEVDGWERHVDLYRWKKANPDRAFPSLLYWGKYVAHDNNRDGMGLSLALSRHVTKTFLEYKPQVFHDLHESIPFLYVSTGMGPYNAWLDPIVINEWQKMSWNEVEQMTRRGVPGVWTHGFYDGWAANYMFTVANGHNAIGRFYETFGNGGADTMERTVPPSQSNRAWFRPNPPLPKVLWSHRNNVNLQQSGLLLSLDYAATNKETFLRNFWLKGKRSIAKPENEGPAAYVISREERPNEAASLASLLMSHGVEVHTLDGEVETGGARLAEGSFVIRMDQPYSRMADMFLDRQYYNPNDTPPYDDTGWTLSALRNLKSVRVAETSLLQAPMSLATAPPAVEGRVQGEGRVFLVNHNAERNLARLRYALVGLRIHAAEAPFEAGGRKYKAGSFIIDAGENPADLRQRLEDAAKEHGITIYAAAALPDVARHPVSAPRIALVHTWLSTQTEGWFRVALDGEKIPYKYIPTQYLREKSALRDEFDVIILGPTPGSAQRIVNGTPVRGQPVPWDASIGPNVAGSPDTAADTRGGMGLEGVANIQKFVEAGGVFVTIASNASLPIDYGLIDGVSITQTRELRARGSVLNAAIADARSPITYGYEGAVPVYFNSAPVLDVAPLGIAIGGGPAAAASAARPTGRGTATDRDRIQGRPDVEPPPPLKPGELAPDMLERVRHLIPPPAERPRTVLKFAEEKDLLVSGMLAGGRELAGKPAIVQAPSGKGHYLLFAINPMWRNQTQGSFMFLLNAAMHYDHLHLGQVKPAQP